MKYYKGEFLEITEIEIERENKHYIIFKDGYNVSKNGISRWYRASREEAKACMIKNAEDNVSYREKALADEKEKLERIKAL